MKILSALSLVLLGVFSSSIVLAKQCTTSWELKSSGFTLGTTKEVLNIRENGSLDLTADFNPNAALKIFGVDRVKRVIVLDDKQTVLSRLEVVGVGEDAKKVLWKPTGTTKTYHRIVRDEIVDTVTVEESKKIIDSTIFPYMLYLGMFDSPKMNVKVFGGDPAYEAVVGWTTTDKTRLDFAGGKNKGYVIVNEDKYPQYFSFTQDGKTVEGIQKSWQCN
jgi:hypothetical protein